MFCEKCGKEIAEGSTVCIGCGCPVNEEPALVSESSPVPETASEVVKQPKIKKLWVILGAIVLTLGIVAAVLFVPRNLKIDDFKKTNVVTAIIKYGLPESINSYEDDGARLQYYDKIDFYGITPYSFAVYPDEDEVFLRFHDEEGRDVYRKIDRYCDFEENLLDVYHIYSYDDMEITIDPDGTYIHIEINE